jgi:hypothetical protein
MTACLAGRKEVTIALPGIIDIFHSVGVVIPIEGNQERFYMDAFTLFSIAFCFLSLADQARIHIFLFVSFHWLFFLNKKARVNKRVPLTMAKNIHF